MKDTQLRQAVAHLERLPATRRAQLQVIWTQVVDAIHTDMERRRPSPKVFEVHHAVDVARGRFFAAMMAGRADDYLRTAALSVLVAYNPMRLTPP